MKNTLYYHIWTPPQTTTSILKDIDKIKPNKIKIYALEEFEIDSRWTYNQYEIIRQKIIKNNIDVEIMFGSADIEFYKGIYHFPEDNIKVSQWPYFFLFFAFATLNLKQYSTNHKQDYKVPFISMNGRPHTHRCVLLDLLAKNNLVNKGSISWNPLNFDCHYPWSWWKTPSSLTLSDNFKDTGHQYYLPNEWHTSFLNLVSETTIETIFFTEKTWIPLLCRKPFIVQSRQGFYKKFQELGFEIYDEIFDYSFDKEEDLEKRTQLILNNVSEIYDKKYNKLYKKIYPKIMHNYNRAISILKDSSTIPTNIKTDKFSFSKYGGLFKHVDRILKEGNF